MSLPRRIEQIDDWMQLHLAAGRTNVRKAAQEVKNNISPP